MASLVVQSVQNLPAMLDTWVRSLGWEDSLEKEKATHSSILVWRIPGLYSPSCRKKSWTHLSNFHFSIAFKGVSTLPHIIFRCVGGGTNLFNVSCLCL